MSIRDPTEGHPPLMSREVADGFIRASRGDLDPPFGWIEKPGIFKTKEEAIKTGFVWLALAGIVGLIIAGIIGVVHLATH